MKGEKNVDGRPPDRLVKVKEEWCKGCGICVAFCPRHVLGLKNEKVVVIHPEDCNKCGQCELRCPDYAIYAEGDE